MDLQHQVATALNPHIHESTKIVIALSGGIDSVVLLDAVSKLELAKSSIIAVHVHHGLSAKADDWLVFCRELCASYNIPFHGERVKLDDISQGIEAAARQARYGALAKYVDAKTLLLTAQHRDDQTETLLLALKRGSGVRGLAAMPTVLPFEQGQLHRPLLMTSRASIEDYAAHLQLQWVEDDSNGNVKFDRNYLRLEVLPKLNQRWPGFSANVARTAQLCQQANQLLDEIATQDLAIAKLASDKLCLERLGEMSDPRINNVLRMWLRDFGLEMPSQTMLSQLVTQMSSAKRDSDPAICVGKYSIRRYQQAIYMVPNDVALVTQCVEWTLQRPLWLGQGIGSLAVKEFIAGNALRKPLAGEVVSIRFSVAGNMKVAPLGRDKRRSVKKLLQEFKIPTWQRQTIPFVFYNEQLVAAVGLWIDKEFLASNEQEAISIELLIPIALMK